MDQENEIESLWQRVYHSINPDTVLAEFFHHKPIKERGRLLRRCYRTGEQFGLQLEQQELTCYTALAYIYTFGLQSCSSRQLQISPSPAVAELIKDRRYQLYSSIQRRPGWRQFPFNIIPSGIWRYKNQKDYLGQDILRLYIKLAYRTPDFDSALALLAQKYQSGGKKRLTKTVLTRLVEQLPSTVPGLQTFSNPGSSTAGAHDIAQQRPLSPTPSPADPQHTSNIDIERHRRQSRASLPAGESGEVSDILSDRYSAQDNHFEENPPLDPLIVQPDFSIFSDTVRTATPARSPLLPSSLSNHTQPHDPMPPLDDQQRKRARLTHKEMPETPPAAFDRAVTDAITTAKLYDSLAAELSHLEAALQRESSAISDLRSRWQAGCSAKGKAERNLIAQKEIFMSVQEDVDNTSDLKDDMTGLIDRWEAQVVELGHNADVLKAELDEKEERRTSIHDNIKEKVAEMSKIGQDWGWGSRQLQLYEAYHWIGKTFGKAGAEDHCKNLQAAAETAGSSTDGG